MRVFFILVALISAVIVCGIGLILQGIAIKRKSGLEPRAYLCLVIGMAFLFSIKLFLAPNGVGFEVERNFAEKDARKNAEWVVADKRESAGLFDWSYPTYMIDLELPYTFEYDGEVYSRVDKLSLRVTEERYKKICVGDTFLSE